jgi:hypothetical protein
MCFVQSRLVLVSFIVDAVIMVDIGFGIINWLYILPPQ